MYVCVYIYIYIYIYKLKPQERLLHIEDPIDVGRNLNFALGPEEGLALRDALAEAHGQIRGGVGFGKLLGVGSISSAKQVKRQGFISINH